MYVLTTWIPDLDGMKPGVHGRVVAGKTAAIGTLAVVHRSLIDGKADYSPLSADHPCCFFIFGDVSKKMKGGDYGRLCDLLSPHGRVILGDSVDGRKVGQVLNGVMGMLESMHIKPKNNPPSEPLSEPDEDDTFSLQTELADLTIAGVNESQVKKLAESGIVTVNDVIDADLDDLVAVESVGDKTARRIKSFVGVLV